MEEVSNVSLLVEADKYYYVTGVRLSSSGGRLIRLLSEFRKFLGGAQNRTQILDILAVSVTN